MSASPFDRAVARWREVLPGDAVEVRTDAVAGLLESREGLHRSVPAVLRPANREQVQAIMRIASSEGAPVYPYSTGRNWGLGSSLPATDGCAALDLSRMNAIRALSAEGLYARVEPGVTQGQLYDEIVRRDLPVLLNVTGSARDTSLIGNALERGVGYFRSRADALSGLEVVLAGGELLRTGFSDRPEAKTADVYGPGVGPDLGALFSQSNFGVVTAAGFRLLPRPEAQAVMLVTGKPGGSLEAMLDACIGLRRGNVTTSVLHLANGERSRITLEPLLFDIWMAAGSWTSAAACREAARRWLETQPTRGWNAVCGLMGPPGVVRAALRAARKRMRGVAGVRAFSPRGLDRAERVLAAGAGFPPVARKLHLLRALRPLLGLGFGVPSDAPLRALDWDAEPDGAAAPGRGAVLYSLPLYPAVAAEVAPALRAQEAIAETRGFAASATLNVIDAHTVEGVISIAFDGRDDVETARAHACIREMEARSIADGFPPYRTGLDRMDLARAREPGGQTVARGLKFLFDPGGVIAPGRYLPGDETNDA